MVRYYGPTATRNKARSSHGLEETETSITGKLARGTFAASFFLACLAVLERDAIRLEEIC